MEKFSFEEFIRMDLINDFTKKSNKNIVKRVKTKGLVIMPEPEHLALMLSSVRVKRSRKYTNDTIISVIENINLLYTEHSSHTVDSYTVLTYDYLRKYLTHFAEGKKIFNTVWEEQYQGNNINGYASSYTKKIETKGTLFTSGRIMGTIINSLLRGTMTFNEYKEVHKNKILRQNGRKGIRVPLEAMEKIETVYTKIFKDPKISKTIASIEYKTFPMEFMDTLLDEKNKIDYVLENQRLLSKKAKESLNKQLLIIQEMIKNMKYNEYKKSYILSYEAKTSIEAGRIYHQLNRMPKILRAKLFNGVELDIDNMAFKYFINEYSELDLEYIKHYTSNKTNTRNKLAEDLGLEVKEIKEIMLKILFGSLDNRDYKESFYLNRLKDDIKTIRDFIMDRDNIKFTEAKSKMSQEFMKQETKVINDLLLQLGLDRTDVIDIHDGIIVPEECINRKTLAEVKKIEQKYNLTFSGKTKIKNILIKEEQSATKQNEINEMEDLIIKNVDLLFYSKRNFTRKIAMGLLDNPLFKANKDDLIKTLDFIAQNNIEVKGTKHLVQLIQLVVLMPKQRANNITYITLVNNIGYEAVQELQNTDFIATKEFKDQTKVQKR